IRRQKHQSGRLRRDRYNASAKVGPWSAPADRPLAHLCRRRGRQGRRLVCEGPPIWSERTVRFVAWGVNDENVAVPELEVNRTAGEKKRRDQCGAVSNPRIAQDARSLGV